MINLILIFVSTKYYDFSIVLFRNSWSILEIFGQFQDIVLPMICVSFPRLFLQDLCFLCASLYKETANSIFVDEEVAFSLNTEICECKHSEFCDPYNKPGP